MAKEKDTIASIVAMMAAKRETQDANLSVRVAGAMDRFPEVTINTAAKNPNKNDANSAMSIRRLNASIDLISGSRPSEVSELIRKPAIPPSAKVPAQEADQILLNANMYF